MSQTVTLSDAKAQFSQLVERAEAGEEIIITKAVRPMARLGPFEPAGLRKPGLLKGKIVIGPDFDAPIPFDTLGCTPS